MKSSFGRLLRLALPIKGWMALAALCSFLTIASGIGLMATSAYLISAAAFHPSIAALGIAIVSVRFFGIARGVFRYLERILAHKATFRLLANLRVWFYSALEPLLPARLIEYGNTVGMRNGDLLRRAVADIETLQNFYLRIIAPPAVAALIGCVMWLFLGAWNGVFALIWLVSFLLASIGIPLLTHLLSQKSGRQLVTTRATLHAQIVDSMQGIADLIAFGQERQQARQIQELNNRLSKAQKSMAHISGMQTTLSNLCMNLTLWTMLLLAIPVIRAGQMNGVFLALIVLATLASFESILPLPGAFQQVAGNLASAQRLFEIVDAQPSVQDPATPSPVPQDYTIAVQHLHFRYNAEEQETIQNNTFTLRQGQCVAIVGPSGAGKSTLAHLILRYWDYQKGQILLGGHELQRYRREDLYHLISGVEQDTHLFNTTIRKNIMLARPDASYHEMLQAAQQAQLHDFVQSLPDGYDTQIGEQGLRLSGGERQRIAIARAFLKDAPILLLDEPTVNLDAITERAILQSLHSLSRGRTTLLITHRLIEMDMADEILVMQNGSIIERGKHDALLRSEGTYWHMWQQQAMK